MRGLQASVTVRTVEGDVQVSDVQGAVSARSVDGVVVVEGIQGIVSVTTVEEAATLRRIRGRVQAESTDGDIFLEEVEGELVEAVTVDGDITFQGNVVPLGSYRLVTHDGDVVVTLPASTGADVSVSTFDGSFRSDFQVTVGRFQLPPGARWGSAGHAVIRWGHLAPAGSVAATRCGNTGDHSEGP